METIIVEEGLYTGILCGFLGSRGEALGPGLRDL